MKKITALLFLANLLTANIVLAQKEGPIKSGPMLGNVELRTAIIWAELNSGATSVKLTYWKEGVQTSRKTVRPIDGSKWDFRPVHFELVGLDPATTYQYEIESGNQVKVEKRIGTFTTKKLWQWREPAPDFNFITGSCAYFNENGYDRPGRPYGGDTSIFQTMGKEKTSFMLWLGDNWYTREVDYSSPWGLWYRVSRERAMPVMKDLFANMPNYAIWDDHDFGPNDIGKEYIFKEESREVFKQYWANPSYGENGKGIYTKFSYSDVDIFMLDDRTWRSSDELMDSIDGKPNTFKEMFGKQQMEWLMNALAGSSASFKIVATGTQMLNPVSPYNCFRRYPAEYNALLKFIDEQKIPGVVFLTGDRHHSEVIELKGKIGYPLYDITVSPLTSGTHIISGPEKDNPYRVFKLDQKQNYGKVSVAGKPGERVMKVEFFDAKGSALGEWSVESKSLSYPKK